MQAAAGEREFPSEQTQGAREFSFLHPGVVFYCTLFPPAPHKKHILHFKLPRVISISVLVSATWEQTAPQLSCTQVLSLQVRPPSACITQLLLLSHPNLFITSITDTWGSVLVATHTFMFLIAHVNVDVFTIAFICFVVIYCSFQLLHTGLHKLTSAHS